jgi:hypothetical protein
MCRVHMHVTYIPKESLMLACTIILNYIVSTFNQALACAELREFTTTQLIMWLACGDAFASICVIYFLMNIVYGTPH